MLGWRADVEGIMTVKYQTIVYALTFFIASCSDPFTDVHKAAVALQAAEKQGLTLADFQHLTQQLAAQVDTVAPDAKDRVSSARLLDYRLALVDDKVATEYWTDSLDHGGMLCGNHMNSSRMTSLMDYNVPFHWNAALTSSQRDSLARELYGFQFEQFKTLWDTGQSTAADNFLIQQRGRCSFREEALSAIWHSQDVHLAEAFK